MSFSLWQAPSASRRRRESAWLIRLIRYQYLVLHAPRRAISPLRTFSHFATAARKYYPRCGYLPCFHVEKGPCAGSSAKSLNCRALHAQMTAWLPASRAGRTLFCGMGTVYVYFDVWQPVVPGRADRRSKAGPSDNPGRAIRAAGLYLLWIYHHLHLHQTFMTPRLLLGGHLRPSTYGACPRIISRKRNSKSNPDSHRDDGPRAHAPANHGPAYLLRMKTVFVSRISYLTR